MPFLDTKHLLTGAELGPTEVARLLDLSIELKKERDQGILRDDLKGKTLALLFDKPSLRTRMSFNIAMTELGGNVFEAAASMRKQETPEDMAGVLNGYVHAVMLRTHEHEDIKRLSTKAKFALINGLCNDHHPCQALADVMTLKQNFGKTDGITMAYIGDGNNVLHSLLMIAPVVGVHVRLATPVGFEAKGGIVEQAMERAKLGGGSITICATPDEAVKGAQAIYTDVWTSMGFEEENQTRLKAFKGFQVNRALHDKAAKDAILLHCMPMVRGQEITDEMCDHECSRIYQQAENRLHTQKALLLGLLGK